MTTEMTRGWMETANAVNSRVIGIFSTQPTISGKKYSIRGTQTQTLQEVWEFDDALLTIPLNVSRINQVYAIYGGFTDGTIWYPLPYVDPVPGNQVGVTVLCAVPVSHISIIKGGTAPAITQGIIIMEWS